MRPTSCWSCVGWRSSLGIAAERAAFDPADVRLWLPDLLVGWVLVGVRARRSRTPTRQPHRSPAGGGRAHLVPRQLRRRAGEAVAASDQLVYLHRGFLVHLLVAFPDGSASSRGRASPSASGYVAALLPAVWDELRGDRRPRRRLLVGYCALDHQRSRGAPPSGHGARRWSPRPGSALVLVGRGAWRAPTLPARQRRPAVAAGLPGRPVRDRGRPAGRRCVGVRPGARRRHRPRRRARHRSDPATCGPRCRRPSATRPSTSATGSPTPARSSPRTGGGLVAPGRGLAPVGHLRGARRRAGRRPRPRPGGAGGPSAPGGGRLGDPAGGREQPPAGRGPRPGRRPRGVAAADPRDARRRAPAAGAPPARRSRAPAAGGRGSFSARPVARQSDRSTRERVARAEEQVRRAVEELAPAGARDPPEGACPRTVCAAPCGSLVERLPVPGRPR